MYEYNKPTDKKILFNIKSQSGTEEYQSAEINTNDYCIAIKEYPNDNIVIIMINNKNGDTEKIISNVKLNYVPSEHPDFLYYYQLETNE